MPLLAQQPLQHAGPRSTYAPGVDLAPTERLLTQGGDARIIPDGKTGMNRYGCAALPEPLLAAFGSSTASVISAEGFAAAGRLRRHLLSACVEEPGQHVYARELERLRRQLARLCGLPGRAGETDIIFGASGTDMHLIAAQLAAAAAGRPLTCIMIEGAETGSGVAASLGGRHFSNCTAQGDIVRQGEAIAGLGFELVAIAIRHGDGTPRPSAAVDAAFTAAVAGARASGRHVLVAAADVSKTGLLAPSPAGLMELRRRYGQDIDVLIDGCQFRLAPASLRAYLNQDFMIAVTGSKFLTGPAFSGALLVPPAQSLRFRNIRLPPHAAQALAAYSAKAEWPEGWIIARSLRDTANFGLLLRLEAALTELEAFDGLAGGAVEAFFSDFAASIGKRLRNDPRLEPLPVHPIDRSALGAPPSWDRFQTIFPFFLRHPAPAGNGSYLGGEKTMRVYSLLGLDAAGMLGLAPDSADRAVAARPCQLGQPVAGGDRDGIALSALRLCASARLAVEALTRDQDGGERIIRMALAVLDKACLLVRTLDR